MAQKIYIVNIGTRYGKRYEDYISSKLPNVEFMREPYHPSILLQWNKMYFMSLETTDPIVVMDIDVLLINDYMEMINYPIKRGEFLGCPGWWKDTPADIALNGGFYKYYPEDCRYIWHEFLKNSAFWHSHYITNGTTVGPINGEQYFVRDQVLKNLELKFLPDAWVTRMANRKNFNTDLDYSKWYKETEFMYKSVTGESFWFDETRGFNPLIKFVHFTHLKNLPHEWELYDKFIQ